MVFIILAELIVVGAFLSGAFFLVLLNVGILPKPREGEWLGRFVVHRRWVPTAPRLVVRRIGAELAVSAVSSGLLIVGWMGQPTAPIGREGFRAGNIYSAFYLEYRVGPSGVRRTE